MNTPSKEEELEQKPAPKSLEFALSLFNECSTRSSNTTKSSSSLLKRPKSGELKSELFDLTTEEGFPQWSPRPLSAMIKQFPVGNPSASFDVIHEASGPASAMLKQLTPSVSFDPSSLNLTQWPEASGPASAMLKQLPPETASFDPSSFDLTTLEEVSGKIEEEWFPRISWPTDDGEDYKASDEAFTNKMTKKRTLSIAAEVPASLDSSSSFSTVSSSESADQLMPLIGMRKRQKLMKKSGPAVRNLSSLADVMKQAAYDYCPSAAPESHMIAEYSSPVILIMLFHYTDCTWMGYIASIGLVLLHTLETYCTNFGGTDNSNKKLLDKLQHYLCDCVLLHSLISFLFLMPQEFGPYSFELGLGLLQTLPVYAVIVFKSHFLYELGNIKKSGALMVQEQREKQQQQQQLLGRHVMKCFLAYLSASCLLVLSAMHDDMASIAFLMAGLMTFNLSPYVLCRSYKQQFITTTNSDDTVDARQATRTFLKKQA